jgi:hypothetical protein
MMLENWISACRRAQLNFYISSFTKLIAKWIKGDKEMKISKE